MKSCLFLKVLLGLVVLVSCRPSDQIENLTQPELESDFFVVPGEDAFLDSGLIKKGKVLVAYSDCYQCHKEEGKAKGPSFSDIARRYPIQEAYIDMLARKVISGGTGVWGYPVMSSHPKIDFSNAKLMVTYILSLEKKSN